MRPIIDYGDIIYDQPKNESFLWEKVKSAQYKATLAIADAIQHSSRDKIYQELSQESLNQEDCLNVYFVYLRITNEKSPGYLIDLIHKYELTIRTGTEVYHHINGELFWAFFVSIFNDWFNLDINIRNPESIFLFNLFKCRLLSFTRTVQISIYNIFWT